MLDAVSLTQLKWFVVQDDETGETDILIGSDDPHRAVGHIRVGLLYTVARYIVDMHNATIA